MNRRVRHMLSCVLVLVASGIGASEVLAVRETQAPPTVCQGKDGDLKTGMIDVLVLMDNSGSLKKDPDTGKPGTDDNGLRFDALEKFIDNYAGLSSQGKSFGLIKFSTSAEEVIPLGPIGRSETAEVKSRIRAALGEPGGRTDYRAAFQLSTQILARQPSDNCKILIWFTDGGFNTLGPREEREPDKVARDLESLESSFCGPSGFARIIQDSDVNTFVIFLGDGSSSSGTTTQKRIDASIDVMQVITGDETPSIQSGESRSVNAGNCSERVSDGLRHLGEVVSADEAGDLLGYLTDLANIADGGKPATPGECPLKGDALETSPLPSGQLIDWISVTGWDGDNVANFSSGIKVRTKSQDLELDDLFSVTSESSTSNVVRLEPKAGSEESLAPGWYLKGSNLGRICIRVKPQEVKVRLSGGKLEPVSPVLPRELVENRISLFIGGEPVSVTEAASRGNDQVTGKLQVDNGEVFSADGTLPVAVDVNGLPILLNQRCQIELRGTQESKDSPVSSSTCEVLPAPAMEVSFDPTEAFASLSTCGLGDWITTVDGEKSNVIPAGTQPVRVGISTVRPPQNRELSCAPGDLVIFLKAPLASDGSYELPTIGVVVDFSIVKKPDPKIALLLAAIGTALVSLLSLALLRLVNSWTSKTVRAQDFFGYETDVELVAAGPGRREMRWAGQSIRSFVADIDRLMSVNGNSRRTELSFASINLHRQLPRFTHPFEESRLVLDGANSSVFWKANRLRDGLPMGFPRAMILTALDSSAPIPDRPIRARVAVVVPKRGSASGVDGVQQLVRERGDDMASELANVLAAAAHLADTNLTSPASKGGTSNSPELHLRQPNDLTAPPQPVANEVQIPRSSPPGPPGFNRPGIPPGPPKRNG